MPVPPKDPNPPPSQGGSPQITTKDYNDIIDVLTTPNDGKKLSVQEVRYGGGTAQFGQPPGGTATVALDFPNDADLATAYLAIPVRNIPNDNLGSPEIGAIAVTPTGPNAQRIQYSDVNRILAFVPAVREFLPSFEITVSTATVSSSTFTNVMALTIFTQARGRIVALVNIEVKGGTTDATAVAFKIRLDDTTDISGVEKVATNADFNTFTIIGLSGILSAGSHVIRLQARSKDNVTVQTLRTGFLLGFVQPA